MALAEKFTDPVYVCGLSSIGNTLPDRLSHALSAADMSFNHEALPQVRIELSLGKKVDALPFHTGYVDYDAKPPILYVSTATVLAKATEIRQSLNLNALGVDPNDDDLRRFEVLPPARLLGTPLPRQRATQIDDYCAHTAMLKLALQVIYQEADDISKAEEAYAKIYLNNHS